MGSASFAKSRCPFASSYETLWQKWTVSGTDTRLESVQKVQERGEGGSKVIKWQGSQGRKGVVGH